MGVILDQTEKKSIWAVVSMAKQKVILFSYYTHIGSRNKWTDNTQSCTRIPAGSLDGGLKHSTVELHRLGCEGDHGERVGLARNTQCCSRQIKNLHVTGRLLENTYIYF